jgi:hypothetical protein
VSAFGKCSFINDFVVRFASKLTFKNETPTLSFGHYTKEKRNVNSYDK